MFQAYRRYSDSTGSQDQDTMPRYRRGPNRVAHRKVREIFLSDGPRKIQKSSGTSTEGRM